MKEKTKKSNGQSFLRWAGSKKQLLPHLTPYYSNNYKRYVEPFAGSACLFFQIQPSKAMLGDINSELISTYRDVKYRAPKVISSLRKMKKGKQRYLDLRKKDPTTLTSPTQAARFIYLNRFCFNGLYRTNLSGEFNVPYGGEKAGNLPTTEALKNCSRTLKGAKLVSGDFEKVLEQVKAGDFVYMDPPFFVESRRVFKEYNGSIFSSKDLKRLRRWLEKLDRMNVAFLVSYAKCKEAKFLSKGYNTREITANRSIAGFSKDRRSAKELLISNINPVVLKTSIIK